jgi:hypothetical protein
MIIMKTLVFLLARSGSVLFGMAMMALVLPFLFQAIYSYHADLQHYYIRQEATDWLVHLTHWARIAGGALFGLSGYFILRDHFYRVTLLITFCLCVLVAHGLINSGHGGNGLLYLPAMFFGCLGSLSLVLTHRLRLGRHHAKARHHNRDAADEPVEALVL